MTDREKKPKAPAPKKFKNPANGYEEEIPDGVAFKTFVFCPVYLILRSLWPHVFAWAIFVGSVIYLWPHEYGFAVFWANFFYAMLIKEILCADYLRKGWLPDVEAKASDMRVQFGVPLIFVGVLFLITHSQYQKVEQERTVNQIQVQLGGRGIYQSKEEIQKNLDDVERLLDKHPELR